MPRTAISGAFTFTLHRTNYEKAGYQHKYRPRLIFALIGGAYSLMANERLSNHITSKVNRLKAFQIGLTDPVSSGLS